MPEAYDPVLDERDLERLRTEPYFDLRRLTMATKKGGGQAEKDYVEFHRRRGTTPPSKAKHRGW